MSIWRIGLGIETGQSLGNNAGSLIASLLVGDALVVDASDVDLHSRGLLLQVIKVIFSLGELDLRVGEVLAQKHDRVGEVVLNHDIGAQPEADFATGVRQFRLSPDVVRNQEVSLHLLIVTVVLLLEHGDHLEGALDLGKLALEGGLLAD